MVTDDELANLLDSIIANTDKTGGPPRHPIRPNAPPMGSHWRGNFMPPQHAQMSDINKPGMNWAKEVGIKKKSRFGSGPMGQPPSKKSGGFTSSNWAPVSNFDNRPPPLKQ